MQDLHLHVETLIGIVAAAPQPALRPMKARLLHVNLMHGACFKKLPSLQQAAHLEALRTKAMFMIFNQLGAAIRVWP